MSAEGSVLGKLSFHQLQLLRAKTREVLLAEGIPAEFITDRECDRWIDSVLPTTAERMIEIAVANGHAR